MDIIDIPFYRSLKALHIIFMVCYFAGVFYLVRLFVYFIDAEKQNKDIVKAILKQQYTYMMRRLWDIILLPGGILMLITGLIMMTANDFNIFKQEWFKIKLLFLFILAFYHYWCWKCMQLIKIRKFNYTSVRLRMMNEVATVILFAVVFIVIFKAAFMKMWSSLLISFIVLITSIMGLVKIINRKKGKE